MGNHRLRAAHLTRVLAAVLARLIDVNEKSASGGLGPVTKFHAQEAPSISVAAYLERIRRFSNCSDECFVIALIYIDRLIESKNFVLSHLNVHRVVITSVLVAAKFFDDHFYNNAYYARVGGVPCSEMNSLEVEFLMCMNYSLFVNEETYDKYRRELANYASSAVPQKALPAYGGDYASEPEPMHPGFRHQHMQQPQQQHDQQPHEQQEPMSYSSPHAQGYFTQHDHQQQHQRHMAHQVSPGLADDQGYHPGGFPAAAPPLSWTYSFPSFGEPAPAFGGNGFGHEMHPHSHVMQMPMHAPSTHDVLYSSSGVEGPVFMMHAAPPLFHQHSYPFGPPQVPYTGIPGPAMYAHPAFYIPVGTR